MTRTEIFTDGSHVNETGGWAAVILRTASGKQAGSSSQEMELRALVEAAKMAEGPCTIISDHEGIVKIAQQGKSPRWSKALWDELYALIEGKDIQFEWRRRQEALGQRIAQQLARGAARGYGP